MIFTLVKSSTCRPYMDKGVYAQCNTSFFWFLILHSTGNLVLSATLRSFIPHCLSNQVEDDRRLDWGSRGEGGGGPRRCNFAGQPPLAAVTSDERRAGLRAEASCRHRCTHLVANSPLKKDVRNPNGAWISKQLPCFIFHWNHQVFVLCPDFTSASLVAH